MAKYASGNQERLRVGFTNNNENDTSLRVVGRVGIGTTIFDASSSLDVRGDTNISGTLTANNVSVSSGTANLNELSVSGFSTFIGIATFADNVFIDGVLQVGDTTFGTDINTRHLNVSGVSTFTGAADFNGDVDVDGHTELDDVHVSGVSTFTGIIDANGGLDVDGHTELDDLNVSGISTFTGASDFNGNLDVDGHTELDNLNVSGVSTFTGAADFNGDVDVDGHTELDDVHVSGVSTFTGASDFNGDVDVDGHTELDDLNVSGISTFASDLDINADVNVSGIVTATNFHTGIEGSSIRITSNTISGPAEMFIDPAAVGDNTGAVRIKGDLFVDGTQTIINSSTIELADFVVGIATTATSDLISDGAGIGIGSDKTFKYYYNGGTNPSLKSSENLNVASGKAYQIDQTEVLNATTLGSGVVNSSLTSVGNLTSLTVDGRIVGAATSNVIPFLYAGLSDLPDASTYHGAFAHVHATGAAYYAHGGNWLELVNKDTNGNVGLGSDLDVDGHTELDTLNVSGISTLTGQVSFGSTATFGDDDRLRFGDNNELDIYYSAGQSFIKSGVGQLRIKAASSIHLMYENLDGTQNESYAKFTHNGGVKLYHDGNEKFETTGIGVSIYDNLNVGTGVTIYGNSGIVSATAFYGDGSNLLNTGATLSAATGAQRLVLTGLTSGTMVNAATDADLTFNATTNTLDTSNLSVGNNLSVTGLSTFTGTAEFDGSVRIDSTLSANGNVGANGQYLKTTGTGVEWASFPSLRSVGVSTATAGQTTFNFSYNVNFLDVFVNGVKLTPSEYTASNGSQIILNTAAFENEIVEFHSYNTASNYGSGGGGGGATILNDLSDVSVGTLADDQLLQYDNANSRWINVSALSVVGAANLNNLSGVTINTPADNELLQYNNATSQWENTSVATAVGTANLNDLSGVTISAVSDDQLLQYNSATSQWENISATTVVGAASSFATKSATATTATAGQTTFNGTYTVGFVDVYLNGVKLSEDQYTATTGTNIVLDEGASENDIVEVVGLTANVPGSVNTNDIVHSTWTLGANGTSHWTFTGPGGLSNTDDPKIYLARGQTYEFVNNSGGSHFFQIQDSGGTAYSTGVTNNGASSGTIRFEVPFSAPNTLQYKCTSHSGMGNTITVYPDISP